jgi:hypothetical protein
MSELAPGGVEMQRGCRALILAGMPGFVRLLCGFLNGTGARPLFLKKNNILGIVL